MGGRDKIDFVGIGAMKCATTWINECLQEHPRLFLAPKDQQNSSLFFNDYSEEGRADYYKKYFSKAKPDQLRGSFNVYYMYEQGTLERMKRDNPEIKLIVCLRNPVARAYSHYSFIKSAENKKWESFEQAAREDNKILDFGLYHKHLRKFFDVFPRENILVLLYEDIEKDRLDFIRKIYRFLGVDDSFVPELISIDVNVSDFKKTKLGSFLHNKLIAFLLRRSRWAWRLKNSVLVKKSFLRFARFYAGKRKSKETIKERIREKLREFYRQDIERLEGLINRNLEIWK